MIYIKSLINFLSYNCYKFLSCSYNLFKSHLLIYYLENQVVQASLIDNKSSNKGKMYKVVKEN